MLAMLPFRPASTAIRTINRASIARYASDASAASPQGSPFAPRHFLGIADVTPGELSTLIRNASYYKQAIKSGNAPQEKVVDSLGEADSSLSTSLTGKTIALTFNKRSTRTRISTEGAVAILGGHPMFLGKDDIQLGVRENYSVLRLPQHVRISNTSPY